MSSLSVSLRIGHDVYLSECKPTVAKLTALQVAVHGRVLFSPAISYSVLSSLSYENYEQHRNLILFTHPFFVQFMSNKFYQSLMLNWIYSKRNIIRQTPNDKLYQTSFEQFTGRVRHMKGWAGQLARPRS